MARACVIAAMAAVAAAPACVIGQRAATLPDDDVATALVLSGTLGVPLDDIARHAWFAVRDAGETRWERWEIWSRSEPWGYVNRRTAPPLAWDVGGGAASVRVHGVLRGERASRFIRCLREQSPRYEHRDRYIPWPGGPNSNTYVDVMMRRCGFRATLPPTAIGKDYRGLAGASFTSGGTGVQIETPLVGVKLGLTEGIEIHILSATIGIDWWPPAIIVPIGEGRIGFADR